jgi:hypothetical protein
MRFPRPGHTAGVILGAHVWPHFPTLNGGNAFCNSAAAIRRYLTDPRGIGLASEDILDLFDSEDTADKQLLEIGEFLSGWIKRAGGGATALTDLFLYYVGHGDFLGNTTDFVMLVRGSRPRREMTSIPARALASVLRDEAPFVRQVVILDCCWSGAAHRIWQSGTASEVAAKGAAELMPNNGTVLLCSSSENMPSMAPRDSEHTMFTGALVEALQAGAPMIHGDLSPRQIRDLAFDAMRTRWGADAVRPVVYAIERGSGDLSDIPLFPNRAAPAAATTMTTTSVTNSQQVPSSEEIISPTRRQLFTIGIPVVAGAAIGSAALVVAPRLFGDKPAVDDKLPTHDPNAAKDRGAALMSETNIRNGVAWFKEHFGAQIAKRVAGTPLTPSFVAALAVSESYYLWGQPLPPMAIGDLLELCVGDTLDAPSRVAFPKTKAALLAVPQGPKMFEIAREALVKTGNYNPAFASIAKNPDKFAHTFGVFSRDLQFFLTSPDFFLQKQWRDFDKCLELALPELMGAVRRIYKDSKATLTDEELVFVGIAYNGGISVTPAKGFRQGYFDGEKFYGERFAAYLDIAATVPDIPAAEVPAASRSPPRRAE